MNKQFFFSIFVVALLLSATVFFYACDEKEPLITTGTIKGTITCAENQQPLSGVSINITPGGSTKTTGDNGAYSFDRLEAQEYTLTFTLSGYNTKVEKITVKPDMHSDVDVVLSKTPIISVSSVSLNKSAITLGIDGTEQLTETVLPTNAPNQTVTWNSSNSNIATVNSNGLVTAISLGTATITVTTQDGNKTAQCVVAVSSSVISVASISLNKNSTTLSVSASEQLTATISPSNATNKTVTWSSSNSGIVSVNSNGLITAQSAGTATITVTTQDGNRTAQCVVTVSGGGSSGGDGVTINGITWATRNVDMPGTFAENPEDTGMFYQWNKKVGWSATDDPMVNSNGGTIWDKSSATGSTWEKANDPCPQGWRIPTGAELQSLNYSIWTTVNGVNGRLYGIAPNQIFLPAAGHRKGSYSNGKLEYVGTYGNYWSSGADFGNRWYAFFHSNSNSALGGSYGESIDGGNGYSVRCVCDCD